MSDTPKKDSTPIEFEVEVESRHGHGISGRVNFKAVFNRDPTRDEICQAQRVAGYSPQGYGGPFNVSKHTDESGKVICRFSCSASCD